MSENRIATTNVRLADGTHDRLKDHCREGETLSAAVDRALDALEREDALPDAVTTVMAAAAQDVELFGSPPVAVDLSDPAAVDGDQLADRLEDGVDE
jgi:hypothetical protein